MNSESVRTSAANPWTAFGLDLAGYSTGKSALAAARRLGSGRVVVSIVSGHPFATKRDGSTVLPEDEVAAFLALAAMAPVFVDSPIDLQGLPCPSGPRLIWQLTKRPVDQAFGAMPPLADRLGSPTARLAGLLQRSGLVASVGERVFETYPAASLELAGQSNKGYKSGRARWNGSSWEACDAGTKDARKANPALATLLSNLKFIGRADLVIGDDDFDAVLCALCGVVEAGNRLEGEALVSQVGARLKVQEASALAPKGYVLLGRVPPQITVDRIEWAEVGVPRELPEAAVASEPGHHEGHLLYLTDSGLVHHNTNTWLDAEVDHKLVLSKGRMSKAVVLRRAATAAGAWRAEPTVLQICRYFGATKQFHPSRATPFVVAARVT